MCFTSNENWLQLNLIFFFLFQILSSSTKYCKCVCVRARACYCDEFNLNLLQETSVIECCANKRRESMEKSVKLVKPVQLVDFLIHIRLSWFHPTLHIVYACKSIGQSYSYQRMRWALSFVYHLVKITIKSL
jgi:hypothetical protein